MTTKQTTNLPSGWFLDRDDEHESINVCRPDELLDGMGQPISGSFEVVGYVYPTSQIVDMSGREAEYGVHLYNGGRDTAFYTMEAAVDYIVRNAE